MTRTALVTGIAGRDGRTIVRADPRHCRPAEVGDAKRYAPVKSTGVEMCRSDNRQYGTRFLAAMPTNLYGPGENCHLASSHGIAAPIRRFRQAKASRARTGLADSPARTCALFRSSR